MSDRSAGSANIAISRVMFVAGFDPQNVIMVDSKGTLHNGRTELKEKYKEKWHICQTTNREQVKGGIPDAMKGADVAIALSKPGPGTIQKEWIKLMNRESVVFACANPAPEIWPWKAKEAGARIVATGRSDFPNQVNNSLVFPAIFRGVLDVRARTITDEMAIAAAREVALFAEERGITEDNIMPTMDEWELFPREAVAVALKAQEQGVARLDLSRDELYSLAEGKIRQARDMIQVLMDNGIIPPAPAA